MNHTSPSTGAGLVKSAVIRDDTAIFTLTLTDEAVSELSAVVTYHDGQQDRTSLARPEPGLEARLQLALNGKKPPLCTIELQAKIADEFQPLPLRQGDCHLNRLLSADLAQINDNLRWSNRISDLETRFFATKNSLRVIGDEFELRARCIVSVGWEGLEQEHSGITDWCRSQYRTMLEFDVGPNDHEALISTLVFWCHLAIHDGRIEMLQEISAKTLDALCAPEAKGIAVYNMLHTAVLLGGWHLANGRFDVAAELFSPSDRLLRLAAREYPRALVNYRELVAIAETAFFCQIGLRMAKGDTIPKGFPILHPETAWSKGSRLRDKGANQRMLKTYLAICSHP